MDPLTGKVIKGYALHERIGHGAFGVVYRAHQTVVDREVAIKVILPQYANQPDFVRRFETEAQLVAHLEHIHIVPLYDYWRDPTGAYLVMRYLRGGNLRDWAQQGPLSPKQALRVLEQVARALDLAHRHAIIHRDIKPTNILLDEEHNAFLTDFGLAKVMGHESTQDAVRGTPEYISPEQIQGQPVSPQSDLYSLGLVLYEMLTGNPAFRPSNMAEMVDLHLKTPVPDLTDQRDDVPDTVNAVIQTATAKTPADRYTDVLALARALREALAAEPATKIEPVAPLIEPLTDREIDVLQQMAQGLSNREIADQLVIAVSTVKSYAGQIYGKFGVANRRQAVVMGQRLGLLEGDIRGDMIDIGPLGPNPYKGLAAFQQADTRDFFGREALVDHLVWCLHEDGDLSRFLALVGPSGSGKSSVVKAGLLPALKRGAVPGSEDWFVVDLQPGAFPLDRLEVALMRVAVRPQSSLIEQLQRDVRGLVRAADLILPDDGELLLVIDQFEELFTQVEDPAITRHMLGLIQAAVTDPDSRVRIILTLRADFLDRPLVYPDFGELLRWRTELITPMTPAELEAAIVRPAENAGVVIESSLVSVLVAEVSEQPGTLPLLEYALTELFDRKEGRTMTLVAYHDLGGALGALARRADDRFDELSEAEQDAARQMFLRLVTLGEGTEDVRRRVRRSELEAVDVERTMMEDVLDAFDEDRLLTFDFDPATREPTVEVAHEALIQRWGRLRGWLDTSRDDVRLQRMLSTAAKDWHVANQEVSYLLSGSRLVQFEDWADQTDLALTDEERTFLEVSITEEAQRRARRRRMRTIAFGATAAVAVIMAVLALYALNEAEKSQAARATSEANLVQAWDTQARFFAGLAQEQATVGDKRRAVLLALEGLAHYDEGIFHPENHQALLDALAKPGMEQLFLPHNAPVNGAIWNRDETRLLTWSKDNTARTWDAITGKALFIMPHEDSVLGAAWNRSETQILTWSNDDTARVWDADGNQLLSMVHTDDVRGAIWNRDETQILTWSNDGAARVWNVRTIMALLTLDHDDTVLGAVWNQTETQILTWSNDGTARVWDDESGIERFALVHDGPVWGARWDTNETQILTWSWDNTARIWDARDGTWLRTLQQADLIEGARWNADETQVLTWSWDDSAQVWDATNGEKLALPLRHSGNVHGAVWNSDETRILTWSDDGFAKVWDARRGNALLTLAHYGPVIGAEWNADETQILTWSWDNTARVWNAYTGDLLFTVRHDDNIYGVTGAAWSADGNTLLTWAGDMTARTWDARRSEAVFIMGHASEVTGAAWNPNESYLVTWVGDTALIWDAANAKLQRALPHEDQVKGAAWNNDGAYLLTWTRSNVRLWDAASGQIRHTFPVSFVIAGAAWSEDNSRILVWRENGSGWQEWDTNSGNKLTELSNMGAVTEQGVRADWTRLLTISPLRVLVWDTVSGEVQFPLDHGRTVTGIAWSPDEVRILTWSGDTTQVWDATNGEKLLSISQPDQVKGAAWNNDGMCILTWTSRTAHIWDATSGEEIHTLHAEIGDSIESGIWNRDGTRILAWAQKRVWVWDATNGQILFTLSHSESVTGAAWNQDGTHILTWSGSTAQIWITDLNQLMTIASRLQIRPLTNDEREQFFLPALDASQSE